MTNPDRLRLIEKRERGTLSETEYAQYIDLLKADPSFALEVAIYQQVTELANTPVSQPARPDPADRLMRWGWPLALTGLLGLVVLGLWLWPTEAAPKPLKDEIRSIYQASGVLPDSTSLGFATSPSVVARLPVRWWQQAGQAGSLRYVFCRDTLFLYVPAPADTNRLDSAWFAFDFDREQLLIRQVERAQRLIECAPPAAVTLISPAKP